VELAELADFVELMDFHRAHQTHGTHLTHGKVPAPRPTPVYIVNMTSMVWNISVGQFSLAAWLCSLPALVQLVISERCETEKNH